jgi:MYXO-CTERM domain-containing protein
VKSACPTDGCPDGERCIKGECRKDECLGAGANICKYQRQCFDNRCQDDPCAGIKCADGQTCREGVCYGKPKATETPKEAIVSEPSDENVNDGGADATVDAGNKDKKSGGNGKDGDIVEIPEPPGCSCSTTEVPGGLSFFLLFFVALLSFRRRRR